jgi:hypothetical protein
MATQYQNLSEYDADKLPDALTLSKQQYAIAVADWNPQITHELLKGAFDTLVAHGVKPGNINVVHVPGTFELTFAAKEFSDDYLCEIDNRKYKKILSHHYAWLRNSGRNPPFRLCLPGSDLWNFETQCPFGSLPRYIWSTHYKHFTTGT